MFKTPNTKISDIAEMIGTTNATVSMWCKRNPEGLIKQKGRITGILPEAVEAYYSKLGHSSFYDTSIIALGTNVGGAGKTSTTINLAVSARRVTGRDKAIVMIDTDSQGSLTLQSLGQRIPRDEYVLDDFFKGDCQLDDILSPVGPPEDNFWIIGSNLTNLYLDRRCDTNQIRTRMLSLFKAIVKHFGTGTKIFVDTPPQLSAISQSIMCALAQVDFNTCYLIPIRSDAFSMEGAKICLDEMAELTGSYKGVDTIRVRCFLSSYDSRLSVSVAVFKDIIQDPDLAEILCNTLIRHSTEVARTAYNQESVFSGKGKSARNLTFDYTRLLFEIHGIELVKGSK